MSFINEKNQTIYKKINEYYQDGKIAPYENDILDYLYTHTDKENHYIRKNYLDALNDEYSISKCYRFARYLAIAMQNYDFKIYEGRLSNFDKEDFPHAWIETDEYIYDVSFPGKWPKKLYYELFNPIIEKEIDLNNDEKYQEYINNNIEVESDNLHPLLTYIDWYHYMKNASTPNPFHIPLYPSWHNFPQDQDKIEENKKLQLRNSIINYWNQYKKDKNIDIPEELLSKELEDYIQKQDFILATNLLYQEYIRFIIDNYELYEKKKNELHDITLWKESIHQNKTGSFCFLISDVPFILRDIKEKKLH